MAEGYDYLKDIRGEKDTEEETAYNGNGSDDDEIREDERIVELIDDLEVDEKKPSSNMEIKEEEEEEEEIDSNEKKVKTIYVAPKEEENENGNNDNNDNEELEDKEKFFETEKSYEELD